MIWQCWGSHEFGLSGKSLPPRKLAFLTWWIMLWFHFLELLLLAPLPTVDSCLNRWHAIKIINHKFSTNHYYYYFAKSMVNLFCWVARNKIKKQKKRCEFHRQLNCALHIDTCQLQEPKALVTVTNIPLIKKCSFSGIIMKFLLVFQIMVAYKIYNYVFSFVANYRLRSINRLKVNWFFSIIQIMPTMVQDMLTNSTFKNQSASWKLSIGVLWWQILYFKISQL